MLYQYYQKIKECASARQTDLFLAGLIFFASVGSFGLGRLSAIWPEKQPLVITDNRQPTTDNTMGDLRSGLQAEISSTILNRQFFTVRGKYIASKNGSAYHYPWCSGAKRIKEANKIWFQTKEEAKAKGYKPAANCEGL